MARGPEYGAAHKAERASLVPIVGAGQATCTEPVCLMPTRHIPPGTPWDLAHDRDTTARLGIPVYHGPAHRRCNRAEGARWRNQRAPVPTIDAPGRRVVLICGPPGAGKTTHAHTLGLTVFDRDDPRWCNSERMFTAITSQLAADPHAQAVVIRSGATRAARTAAATRVGATETKLILTDAETCIRRVRDRAAPWPSIPRQIAAVRQWWAAYEPDDAPEFWAL